ncbi:hypothetical protein [Streptomyces nigrescens]|uniref:hypothetical protein n=1 Tax=Streptomyces nigrescens TaxID=1920 RepID=UPI0036F74D06
MTARDELFAVLRLNGEDRSEADRLLHAYRAEVLDQAAEALAKPIPEGALCEGWEDLIESIEEIRGMADEARRKAEPGMHPKDFLRMHLNIIDKPTP